VGAVTIDDSPQAVRSPPQPCRGADLRDPVAEVGLGSVSGAGERSGVVVAGLARRPGGIPLEVCPSSNIATRAVTTLDEHPIRAFRDAGVTITINSDDPPMFGTELNREYEIAADLLDLDESGLADLARAAVHASYADADVKKRILGEIDEYVAG